MGQQAWPLYKRVLMLDRPADCRTGRLVAQRDLLRGRPEQMHACEMHVYEVHTHEMHAREVHAHEVHACEMHVYDIHTHKMHACEVHAYEVHAMRYTPMMLRIGRVSVAIRQTWSAWACE
jgi:hypothetical protein